jgi:hypothetical protein
MVYSPDSRFLVVEGADTTNRLFDTARRAPIGEAFPCSRFRVSSEALDLGHDEEA